MGTARLSDVRDEIGHDDPARLPKAGALRSMCIANQHRVGLPQALSG